MKSILLINARSRRPETCKSAVDRSAHHTILAPVELSVPICFFLPHVAARRCETRPPLTYHGHNVFDSPYRMARGCWRRPEFVPEWP